MRYLAMIKEELHRGVSLLSIGSGGLALIVIGLGGALWALSPDLEDGRPPRNPRHFDTIPEPMAAGVGMGRMPAPAADTPADPSGSPAPTPERRRGFGTLQAPKLPPPPEPPPTEKPAEETPKPPPPTEAAKPPSKEP
jgi:outer membrane biosynthesis protein TonB